MAIIMVKVKTKVMEIMEKTMIKMVMMKATKMNGTKTIKMMMKMMTRTRKNDTMMKKMKMKTISIGKAKKIKTISFHIFLYDEHYSIANALLKALLNPNFLDLY